MQYICGKVNPFRDGPMYVATDDSSRNNEPTRSHDR